MRITILALSLFCILGELSAQSYADDFESYKSGSFLAESSEQWTTWSDKPGSSEDAKVVTTQAFSGSQSLYLNSNSTDGGPQDLVLPFGDKHDIGNFEYSMMVYLQNGKGAYFNFQGEREVGEIWALNFESSGEGEFRMYNGRGNVAEGNLPMAEWFKLGFELDLSANRWSLLVNDEIIETWFNDFNAIASLNLYPTNNFSATGTSRFWIDDVAYSYEAYQPTQTNLTIVGYTTEGLVFPGRQIRVTALARNLGNAEISSLELDLKYASHSETQSLKGLNLSYADIVEVSFELPVRVLETSEELSISVNKVNENVGDDNKEDDLLVSALEPFIPAAGKMVVLEEGTGTWCGWCPRGMVALKNIEEKYGDLFQGIAIHSGDPMEAPGYTRPFVSAYVSGFPSGQVERQTTIGMAPEASEAAFLEALVEPAHCTIETAARMDESKKQLSVSATYTFTQAVKGKWKVACVIVENGVTGTEDGYSQSNYYAGGGNGAMDGWEDKASDVHYSQMVYDDVARAISPNYQGIDLLPTSIEKGQAFTFEFTFNINDAWKVENMHIVPICFAEDGSIDNGGSESFSDALNNSYKDGEMVLSTDPQMPIDLLSNSHIYPNPASQQVTIAGDEMGNLELTSMNGKVVLSSIKTTFTHEIDIAGVPQGLYLLKLSNVSGVSTRTIAIQ